MIFAPISLLGTGQRAPFIYSLLSLSFCCSHVLKLKVRNLVFILFICTVPFTIVTYFYHIISPYALTVSDQFLSTISSILSRIFIIEQSDSLNGMRYLYFKDNVFFTEWFTQLRGIIPGFSGSMLQHELFHLLENTYRGTASNSIIASLIFNGGLLSIPFYFLFLGYIYALIFYKLIVGKKILSRIIIYSYISLYLSIFVTGGPATFFNLGLFTSFILLFIINSSYSSKDEIIQ